MSTELALSGVTPEKLDQYLDTFTGASALTKTERTQFREICLGFGLNPFKREIYPIAYGSGNYRKLSIIIGYEVYLKRADRIGTLDGWEVSFTGDLEASTKTKNMKVDGVWKEKKIDVWVGDLTAHITIYRKDWSRPFKHEVDWREYTQDNSMWFEKPKTMLKKVVIAQGFRLCFPDEMGGLPYIEDEIGEPQIIEAREVTENKEKKSTQKSSNHTNSKYSNDKIKELQTRFTTLMESLDTEAKETTLGLYAKHRTDGEWLERNILRLVEVIAQSEGIGEPVQEEESGPDRGDNPDEMPVAPDLPLF